jgi:hypothetical protein
MSKVQRFKYPTKSQTKTLGTVPAFSSHYAPLGRTIRLRISVDCTMQAIQVVLGYSGWRLLMVLCPNGAQGDSPGQSEAPPWDSGTS